MSPITPLIPDNAPFTSEQRAWLNGFLAGLVGGLPAGSAAVSVPTSTPSLTAAAVDDAEDYPWRDPLMPIEERMAAVGERPLALKLFAAMGQQDCGQCGYLCKTYADALFKGQETDSSLCVPGGRDTRRVLKSLLSGPAEAPVAPSGPVVQEAPGYSRKHPVLARQTQARPLNGPGSDRDTRHVVIDITESGLHYQPGDALGVFPRNDPHLVAALMDALAAPADLLVSRGEFRHTLEEWLTARLDITKPSDECLALLCDTAGTPDEHAQLVAWRDAGLPEGLDLLDLLTACPGTRPEITRLLTELSPLQPRLYSIASCLAATPGEVHLTVGVVRYGLNERERAGVASHYLAEMSEPGRSLSVYVQRSEHFRLPSDPATAIIMIGPGTGIAPFRAFLQARAEARAPGKAWLFFGNPHADCDFLYQDELAAWLAEGSLTRLSTAFSRDSAHKHYVQHRLKEAGAEIWQWLQGGAHVYVCGDAKRMAADVQQALQELVREHGRLSAASAVDYLKDLARHERYQRDVY